MKNPLGQLFRYERIYCFPNKYGFMGFALFLVMIAAAGTYQNNLIFMMSFLFLGLGLIAILQTARNIRNIEVARFTIEPGFPGALSEFEIALKNPAADLKMNIEVRFQLGSEKCRAVATEIQGRNFTIVRGTLRLPKQRGVYSVQKIGLHTTFPYLLFNAWKYSKAGCEAVVFPEPIGKDLEQSASYKLGEDFSGHKKYENGDPITRIDWKVFARRNQFHVKQFLDGGDREITLDWMQTEHLDTESRLSQYSQWILSAEQKSIRYDLKIPGYQSGFGIGTEHFEQCMGALARKE